MTMFQMKLIMWIVAKCWRWHSNKDKKVKSQNRRGKKRAETQILRKVGRKRITWKRSLIRWRISWVDLKICSTDRCKGCCKLRKAMLQQNLYYCVPAYTNSGALSISTHSLITGSPSNGQGLRRSTPETKANCSSAPIPWISYRGWKKISANSATSTFPSPPHFRTPSSKRHSAKCTLPRNRPRADWSGFAGGRSSRPNGSKWTCASCRGTCLRRLQARKRGRSTSGQTSEASPLRTFVWSIWGARMKFSSPLSLKRRPDYNHFELLYKPDHAKPTFFFFIKNTSTALLAQGNHFLAIRYLPPLWECLQILSIV